MSSPSTNATTTTNQNDIIDIDNNVKPLIAINLISTTKRPTQSPQDNNNNGSSKSNSNNDSVKVQVEDVEEEEEEENEYITLFISKEKCQTDISNFISLLKNQLNETIKELDQFQSNLNSLESNSNYGSWVTCLESLKTNDQCNKGSNVYLTIPNSFNNVEKKQEEVKEEKEEKDLNPDKQQNQEDENLIIKTPIKLNNSTTTSNLAERLKNTLVHQNNQNNQPTSPKGIWTSSKPTSSNIYGSFRDSSYHNSASLKHSPLISGSLMTGSRFFTPRQDSLKQVILENQQQQQQQQQEQQQQNQDNNQINNTNNNNNNNNNNNQELDKNQLSLSPSSPSSSSSSSSSPMLLPSSSPLSLLPTNVNNTINNNNQNNNNLNQKQKRVIKSFIYNRQSYDNCESIYDDSTEEDDIPINESSWETNVIILLPCRHHLKVPASSMSTIESIRQLAWASAKMQGHKIKNSLSNYFFKWNNFEIILDKESIIKDLVISNLTSSSTTTTNPTNSTPTSSPSINLPNLIITKNLKLELVEKDSICRERLVDLQSSEIIGRPIFWKAHIEEVELFNKKTRHLSRLYNNNQNQNNNQNGNQSAQNNFIEMARLTPYPPPSTIPEYFVIKVHFRNQTKSLRCARNHTAETLMAILSDKVKNTLAFDPKKWRFLITGRYQYIAPNVPLFSVELVVESIKRTGEVELTMVELSELGLKQDVEMSNIYNQKLDQNRQSQILDIIFKQSKKNNSTLSSTSTTTKQSISTTNSPSNSTNSSPCQQNLIFNNNNQDTSSSSNSTTPSSCSPLLLNSGTGNQTNNSNSNLELLNQNSFNDLNPLEIQDLFQLRILHAHEIESSGSRNHFGVTSDASNIMVFIEVSLYFGGVLLAPPVMSSAVSFQDTVVWNEWIQLAIPVSSIPNGSRICFSLITRYRSDPPFHVGWVGHRLYDSEFIFSTITPYSLLLWPGKVNPIGTCVDNLQSKDQAIIIAFEFQDFNGYNLKYPNLIHMVPNDSSIDPVQSVSFEDQDRINLIIGNDPLYQLSVEDKQLLWRSRYYCQTSPHSLQKLLQAVNWTDPMQVAEIFRLLKNWPLLSPIHSLELLDPKFADCTQVREYVVKCLDHITDYELELYMLQLVQAIKHDLFHGSVLALFLLGRVYQNPTILAQPFFWHLRADIDNQEVGERFRVLTSALLRFNPQLHITFKQQIQSLKVLENLARQLKDIPMEKRKSYIEDHLTTERANMPPAITVPFDSSIQVLDIIPSKCKAMDSAKVPLWIVYKNKDLFASNFQMIVKTGDDLRQDILTLQLLKLMDHMWKSEGLDLHMTIYKCIATGMGTGLIEVVGSAETAAKIQAAAGGAAGAFKQTPIANWLKNSNLTEINYQKAVTKFTLSCAAYCVATYVLGVGDRHNDNIMVDKYGHLFHIDFGHFLGNFKTFAGFQREKAPFVLTPGFVYVIGKDSPNFQFFVDTCCRAYNILRKNANIFYTMFELMLSTGIPELRSENDILYLRDKFRLDLTDTQATERFTKLIHESINTFTTKLNFAIHIMAHSSSYQDNDNSRNSNSSKSSKSN